MDPLNTELNEETRQTQAEAMRLVKLGEIEDIKWLMSSSRGRRIVNRLLHNAGVFRLSFHTNALQMSFNEGNRNAGLMLLATITEHCPKRFAEMLEEGKQ